MKMTTRAKRENTLNAVRRIFNDHSITFGYRWDFELKGKKFIARSSADMKSHDMNFRSSYSGYDYTLNIRFEDGGLRASLVSHN
jgi:hypothetical protein